MNDLWEKYISTQSIDARNKIIEKYLYLVDRVANQVWSRLPNSVELDDVKSYGNMGLIDAISKFNPELNVKFETYAVNRIRGAILDELRVQDWLPRTARSLSKKVDETRAMLEAAALGPVSDSDIAEHLQIDEDKVVAAQRQAINSRVVSFNAPVSNDADEQSFIGDFVESLTNIENIYSEYELYERFSERIAEIPDRERCVLVLYYYEGMKLSDIGQILGVTESRVCQIHSKALEYLAG